MVDAARVAAVNQCLGEPAAEARLLVELPKRQQPRVTRNLGRRRLYHDRLGCEKIEAQLKRTLRIHFGPPGGDLSAGSRSRRKGQ